jgi:hypothetical protein
MMRSDETSGHVLEQIDSVLNHASRRFAEGASTEESLEALNRAFELVVDVPVPLFLTMSPQTMVSLLEMSGADDAVLAKVAEALLLQADMLQFEGSLIEAGARREQAGAVLEFIDPARAN